MQLKNKRGGKRAGAGRPQNSNFEHSETISFRVLKFAEPQIKEYFKNINILQRTQKLLDLLNSR